MPIFIHSFSEDFHFISYVPGAAQNIAYGISKSNNPINADYDAEAAYFNNSSNFPNRDSSNNPVAFLNQAYSDAQLNSFTKQTDGRLTTSSACQGTSFFVNAGQMKQCVTTCPSEYTSTVAVGSEFRCSGGTPYGTFSNRLWVSANWSTLVLDCSIFAYIDAGNSNICYSQTCDTYAKLRVGPVSNKICADNCNSAFPYKTNSICSVSCPDFVSATASMFHSTDERGDCVSTCTGDSILFSKPNHTYGDSTVKKYCQTGLCNFATHPFFYVATNGAGAITALNCLTSCDDTSGYTTPAYIRVRQSTTTTTECVDTCAEYLDVDDMATIFNGDPIKGECKADCSTDLYFNYPVGSAHWYCVPTCPEDYNFAEKDDSDRMVCKAACSEGLNYREYKQTKKLDNSIDISTDLASSCILNPNCFEKPAYKVCRVTCTPEYTIVTEQNVCLSTCPEPFSNVNGVCMLVCNGERRYRFYPIAGPNCTSTCPENQFIQMTAQASSADIIAQDEDSQCVSSCTDFQFESSTTYPDSTRPKVYCIPSCPFDLYTSIFTSTFKQCRYECDVESENKHSTPDLRCVDNCQDAGYVFVYEDLRCSDECTYNQDLGMYCLVNCPEVRPYSDLNICSRFCPAQRPFLRQYSFCASDCDDKFYAEVCVDTCSEAKLQLYLANNLRAYEPRDLILSTRQCSATCSEPKYPFINENTFECIEDCPIPCQGPVCPLPEMKYRDELMFCREKCITEAYPYIDKESLECLSKCRPERPFFYGKEKECVADCPDNLGFVVKRWACLEMERDGCNTECTDFHQECVVKCPEADPFIFEHPSFKECVCQCPTFYIPDSSQTCKLFCDPSLGFIENNTQDSCLHCFRDVGEQYFFNKGCTGVCPPAHLPDQHQVCQSCLAMKLWTNEKQRCVVFKDCDPLSHFDFDNQICSLCDKPGFMIVQREGERMVCDKNDCATGIIEDVNGTNICFICQTGKFYDSQSCLINCPEGKDYNFYENKCVIARPRICSRTSCFNGTCDYRTCVCNEGFAGSRCDIPLEAASEVLVRVFDFMKIRFRQPILKTNEIRSLIEITTLVNKLTSNSRLLVDKADLSEFIKNTLNYVRSAYIEYSYQSTVFELLDKLLGLSHTFFSLFEDNTFLNETVDLVDEYLNKIQIFNTTMTIVPDFTVIKQLQFKGEDLEFSFGPDVSNEQAIQMDSCLEKIVKDTGLEDSHKFSYSFVRFSKEISDSVERTNLNPILIRDNPKTEMSIFLSSGEFNVNSSCTPNFVDTAEPVTLPAGDSQAAVQKFAKSSFNVFEKNDPLFVDRCVPLVSEDGKDLTLAERQKTLFQNPKEICKETSFQICSVGTLADGSFECNCKGIKDKKKSSLESALNTYPETNHILFTCLDVFRSIYWFTNQGFLLIFIPTVLFVLFGIWSNSRMTKDLRSDKRFEYLRQNSLVYNSASMKEEVYFQECANLEKNIADNHLTNAARKKEVVVEKGLIESLPTVLDLEELEVADQLRYDKRTIAVFAKDVMIAYHGLFGAFFAKSLLVPRIIEMLILSSELNLSLMFNAFFIDDSLVENKNSQEDPSFFSSFWEELPKTMWAIGTTKIVMFVLMFPLKITERQEKRMENSAISSQGDSLLKAFDKYFVEQTCRYLIFYVIVAVMNCIMAYFVMIYVTVYSNSTDIWINGFITGFIIDNAIVKMFFPLILTSTRFLCTLDSRLIGLYKGATYLSGLTKIEL